MKCRQDKLLYFLLFNIPQATIKPTSAKQVHPKDIYVDYNARIKDLSDQFLATQFPNLVKSCARRSLSGFIPLCLNKDGIESVTDSQRVQTAIGLSICEFEASGLDQLIPYECLSLGSSFNQINDDNESVMRCFISRLELRGEWWSTYTGYYQRLDDLCVSYALPFQKDEMIDVFFNVTKFMATVNDFWGLKFDEVTLRVDKEMECHLKRVEEITHRIWQDLANGDEAMRGQFVKFGEELADMLNVSSSQVNKTFSELDTSLILKVDNVNQEFDSILARLETLQNDSITSLELALRETAQNLVGAQHDLLETELNRIISTLGTFTESQLDTLELLQNFGSVTRNMIDGELTAQLEELKSTIFKDWLSMSEVLSKEMKLWNSQVFQNFHMVSERLNCTLAQVNALETRMGNVMGVFQRISSLLTGSILNMRYVLTVLTVGCLMFLISSMVPAYYITNFIARPSIIIVAIYIGRMLGSYIRGIY